MRKVLTMTPSDIIAALVRMLALALVGGAAAAQSLRRRRRRR